MFVNFLLIVVFIIRLIICIKYKKVIITLPYLFLIFVTPFYNILDNYIFVKVFGCGCVDGFNANDFRQIIYSVLTVLAFTFGIYLSKSIIKKKHKFLYIVSTLLINVVLAYYICQLYKWL